MTNKIQIRKVAEVNVENLYVAVTLECGEISIILQDDQDSLSMSLSTYSTIVESIYDMVQNLTNDQFQPESNGDRSKGGKRWWKRD